MMPWGAPTNPHSKFWTRIQEKDSHNRNRTESGLDEDNNDNHTHSHDLRFGKSDSRADGEAYEKGLGVVLRPHHGPALGGQLLRK